MAFWPTVTIRRNGFIGYVLASGMQCDGGCCENLSWHSFYLPAKCIPLFTDYTGLGWGMLRKSLFAFLLPAHKMQSSLYSSYTSFKVARSMWVLTIHHSFRLSPVLLLVAIPGMTCVQPTIFPTVKTCKAMAACAFLTCINCVTGSKLPEFAGIVVSGRANQYSTKAPSSFRKLILNRRCSCHGRGPFSVPYHLPGRCSTRTQSFRGSPPRQLWLPVHRHI